jgi:hypothetical protein
VSERSCIRCFGSLEGYRSHRKICGKCVPPSRSPGARNAEYLSKRVARKCKQCQVDLELGTRKQLCDTCRETPNPRCKKCKKVRPLSMFSRDTSRPSGYFPWCSDCAGEARADGKFQNPDDPLNGHICPLCDTPVRGSGNRRFDSMTCKERVRSLKRNFNLEVSEYRELVDATGGRCPICTNRPTQWHVDHNHKTRRVTGVVCQACNVGSLAMTYHDIEYVRRLLAYLESTPADQLGIEALAPEGSNKPSMLHKKWGFRGKRPA